MFEAKTDFHKLASSLRAGDDDAYEFVINSFRRLVIWYFIGLGIRYEDADELFSDIMQKLWRTRCRGYDPNRSSFPVWLLKVARNLALDRARQNIRAKFVALAEARECIDPKTVDEKYSGEYDWELVERAFDSLNKGDQEVIKFKLDGLTYEEMSKIFGGSPSAAGMRVLRAVERLRSAVEGPNNDGPRGPNQRT